MACFQENSVAEYHDAFASERNCSLVGQTVAKWVQRLINVRFEFLVSEPNLAHRPRPTVRQLACRAVIAKEYVGDALPFGARQPGSDPGLGQWQLLGYDQWPAGEDDDHQSAATASHSLEQTDFVLIQMQIGAIADAFCVWWFVQANDTYVRFEIAGKVT